MKTLQEQYQLIKEGKGRQDLFMKQALRQFPQFVSKFNSFDEATSILKGKQIISEGIGGVTTGRPNPFANWDKFLAEEAKAEEKNPTKEVTDMETEGFDYKDPKNIDNVYGESFLQGYYAEMKDPKNADKSVDELKEIVAKNLAKDRTFYTTNQAFGIKGIGYETEVPGLGTPKEVKGKYASSGMEEVKLKENMIRLTDLISESYSEFQRVDKGRTDVDAKNKGEEDTFGAGVEKGEEIEKKRVAKSKPKKESVDTKLAEIDKQGKIVTMEAQIDAIDELIESKSTRLSMIDEDENLSELVDKKKKKEMEKEIKELQKRRAKMEKIYEKLSGKAYVKTEVVDEATDELDA